MFRHLLVSLLLASAPVLSANAAALPSIPAQVSSPEWEQDMRRFAQSDAASPPPKHAVLFVGSSSIRFWDTLAGDFPDWPTINRGFGGSQVRDATWYADRIVIPYRPRAIVFYAGDNDLVTGRTPEQVRDDVHAFVARVRRALPQVPIFWLSIKPSPSRQALMPQMQQANALVRADLGHFADTHYVDVATPMLGADGLPDPTLFREDMLHMRPAGYVLWTQALAPALHARLDAATKP